jgi:hypothetical protein
MSRGLGRMQRSILSAYNHLAPKATGIPQDVEMGLWAIYAPEDVQAIRQLRHEVAFSSYGGWRGQRQSEAFAVSFARALHTLVRRGLLVPVSQEGWERRSWSSGHIRFVVRGVNTTV